MIYDRHILEDLQSRVDIVDVIGSYIELRRAGSNYKGKCPFHNDTHPSMIVSPSKQFYKCFVCDAGGDAFKFVKDYNNVSFIEAVKIVAERISYKLPEHHQTEQDKQKLSLRDAVQKALDYTADFYHQKLFSLEGKVALDYLRQRKFSDEIIKQFNLGYAPNSWNATQTELMRMNFEELTLLEAKIILKKEGSSHTFDMFRDRLMFPIRDFMGRTIAFGGRKLDDDPNNPKYINSPESIVYNKSNTLYGLFEGKREVLNKNELILVEGYMDLISLAQFGFHNTAAPCGTAFTAQQAATIKRYAKSIILMYDGDEAGLKAADRSVDITIPAGLETKLVLLPEGEDPDDILKSRGAKTLQQFIDNSRDFIDFTMKRNSDILTNPEGKAEVARRLTSIISMLPDRFVHDDYMQKAASALHLSPSQLEQLYKEKVTQNQAAWQNNQQHYAPEQQSPVNANVRKTKVNICEALHLLPEEVANELSLAELNLLKIMINSDEPLVLIEEQYDIHSGYFHSILGKNIYSIIYEYAYDNKKLLENLSADEEVEKYFVNIIMAIAMPAEELYADWDKYGGMIEKITEKEIVESAINEIIRQKLKADRRRFETEIETTASSDMQRQIMTELLHIDKRLREKNLLQYKDTLLTDDIDII